MNLSTTNLAIAATLIFVNASISLALQLGLERRLLIASFRMVVQLTLLGFVLHHIFAVEHWLPVVALASLMTIIAGVSAVQRTNKRYPGIWLDGILAMGLSSWLIFAITIAAVVPARPWYEPQYAIPLLGMILGNTVNGISLGMKQFTDNVVIRRHEIECRLTMGATRWEAARPLISDAVKTGMVPILNSMAIVGLVSLPGMMTGQLLAGADPQHAVRYQIVIMFLIASATAVGAVISVMAGYRRLFNRQHQIDFDKIH